MIQAIIFTSGVFANEKVGIEKDFQKMATLGMTTQTT